MIRLRPSDHGLAPQVIQHAAVDQHHNTNAISGMLGNDPEPIEGIQSYRAFSAEVVLLTGNLHAQS